MTAVFLFTAHTFQGLRYFLRTFHFFNSIKVRDETFLRTACFAEKKGTSIKVSHLNLLDITVNSCRIEASE